RLHLEGLPLRRRGHDASGCLHGTTGREAHHFLGVVGKRTRRNYLNGMERRAVREVDKGDSGLRVTPSTYPAADCYLRIVRRASRQNVAHRKFVFHHLYYLQGSCRAKSMAGQPSTVYSRALHRAADLLGGKAALRAALHVPMARPDDWLEGVTEPPMQISLTALH